ncbi:MAG: heavy metal translocating P-type ATPase [Eubacteriaceae bacterium]|jgi:Cu+-exporting ATPase|nr:heavy metal translocating P-type ATPase [Eubacteriaceae bacterium]
MDKETVLACGMLDPSHALVIEKAAPTAPGVSKAEASFLTGKALISYDDSATDPRSIARYIGNLGFESVQDSIMNTIAMQFSGDDSSNSALRFENSLTSVDGIESVSITGGSLVAVKYDRSQARLAEIQKIARESGPCAVDFLNCESSSQALFSRLKKKLAIRLCFVFAASAPVLFLSACLASSAAAPLVPSFLSPGSYPLRFALAQMLFSLLALISAWPMAKRAVRAASRRSASMDAVAIALFGSLLLLSFWETVQIALGSVGAFSHLAFGSACGVLCAAWATQFLAFSLSLKMQSRYSGIVGAAPQAARKVGMDGVQSSIPANEAQQGDVLVVQAGEGIPCDGTLISPEAAVFSNPFFADSGEQPVAEGEMIYMSSVNANSPIRIKASKNSVQSFASAAYRIMRDAQFPASGSREPAAKASMRSVLYVFAASAAVGLFYGFALGELGTGIKMFASVAACAIPVPLLIALPLHEAAGCLKAAKRSAFFRSVPIAKEFGQLKTLLFARSSLFASSPHIAEFRTRKGSDSRMVLQLAASAEAGSRHRYANALLRLAAAKNISRLDAENVRKSPEGGVEAQVNGFGVAIGSTALMLARGIDMGMFSKATKALAKDGKSVVYIAVDGNVLGMAAFSEQFRNGCPEVFADIEKLGVECRLLSSDPPVLADTLVQQTGMSQYAPKDSGQAGIAVVESKPDPAQDSGAPDMIVELCETESLQSRTESILVLGNGLNAVKSACLESRHMVSFSTSLKACSYVLLVFLCLLAALAISEPGISAAVSFGSSAALAALHSLIAFRA